MKQFFPQLTFNLSYPNTNHFLKYFFFKIMLPKSILQISKTIGPIISSVSWSVYIAFVKLSWINWCVYLVINFPNGNTYKTMSSCDLLRYDQFPSMFNGNQIYVLTSTWMMFRKTEPCMAWLNSVNDDGVIETYGITKQILVESVENFSSLSYYISLNTSGVFFFLSIIYFY